LMWSRDRRDCRRQTSKRLDRFRIIAEKARRISGLFFQEERMKLSEKADITLAERIRGAIWGQFTGDAFCLGSHWIYDLQELERRFPGGPQGFEAPASGHYHYGKRPGDLTHYGDGALLLLQSLAECGRFDAVDFGSRFVTLFDSSDYQGYRDHATKDTLTKYHAFRSSYPGAAFSFQEGADDDQPATVSRLAPLAALHFRENGFLSIVEQATLVSQKNDRAVAYAKAHAMILRELFSGRSFPEAVRLIADHMAMAGEAGREVAEKLDAAMASLHLDVKEATLVFGQACPLAASFPAAVHCVLSHGEDFAGALRATAAAGGDNAGRAAMIGAWLGAALGVEAIPRNWRENLSAQSVIDSCVEQIVAASGNAG
jgi:ADP-ribosylglycohydrolase